MNGLKRTLIVIVLLAAAAFLSWEALKVRDVTVVGTKARLPAEVAAISGISIGDSLLTLDKDSAREGIESDPYFKFDDIEIDWPSGIIIRITERVPRAYIQYLNTMIIMDETGFVLEISQSAETSGLVAVGGLQVKTYLIGQKVEAENPDQVLLFSKVYSTFQALGMTDKLVQINITQSLTAKVITRQGITVDLGSEADLERKVRLMGAIVDELLLTYSESALSGTTLDVSTGEFGDFNPGTGNR